MNNINQQLSILLLKHLIAALLIVTTIGTVAAQSNSEEILLTEEEQVWIAEHPVITATSNTALAPFDFMSAGQPAGLSIDYLNLIGAKVGIVIDYVNFGTWSNALEKAMNKEIDLMHTISKNEERAKYLNFSAPYFNVPIVNFGRTGSQRIYSIGDLADKRIGIIKDHIIGEAYKKDYSYFNLIEFNTHTEAITALSQNNIDVYTGDKASIEFFIRQNNIQRIDIIGNDFVLENNIMDQRISVHKDNPILMAIINKGIAAVSSEELNAITEKWIKSDQTTQGLRLTLEELDWLADNKIIKVSADKDSFPLEFINEEGEISGISGDFLNEISKRLSVKFVWAGNQSWHDGLLKIQSRDGDIDMVSGVTPTKERQTFLEFSDVYLNAEFVIVSRIEGAVYPNINALDGRTLAQVHGTAVVSYLRENYPNIKIIETDTRRETLELVSSGSADAMVADVTRALSNISNYGFENLSIVGTTPYLESTAMGVSDQLPLLSSAIQKAITDINPATRSAILTRWFTQRIESKVDYGPLYYVIGLAAIIIILSFIWVAKLRQEILKRVQAETKANIASQAKNDFLASMSHDLRTPLNAIIGFSETISNEIFGPINNKKYADYIDDIHSSGKYLLHLVNDILDLSVLEAEGRKLDYEVFDGEQLIFECKNIVFKLAEDKNIDIVINNSEKLPNVYAERTALKQILMNLISNAIKFTPPNGNITISSNVSNDNYIFQISDTGCGISEENIKIIVKPFMRAKHSPYISHEDGAGLGLSIVNSLVDAHRGELRIESIIEEGTIVTVSLPLQNAFNKVN